MDLIAVIWVKIKARIIPTWPVCGPASGETTKGKNLRLHCNIPETIQHLMNKNRLEIAALLVEIFILETTSTFFSYS